MAREDRLVVLITGASAGIGAALAREYARRGADLVLAARRAERLERLAAELEEEGVRALPVGCDVTRDGDLEAAVEAARETFGRLDVVVANAGFGVVGEVRRLELDDFRRQLETNLFGVLRTVHATLDELVASRGCLAIVGSVNSFLALPGSAPYAVSKFAVRALAEALRLELAPLGVGVVLLAPGFVESELRQVDNAGAHHPHARDPIPGWLRMPSSVAARKMATAIQRRKRVAVITAHGRLAVTLARHFPGLLSWLVGRFGVKGRRPARSAASGRAG